MRIFTFIDEGLGVSGAGVYWYLGRQGELLDIKEH